MAEDRSFASFYDFYDPAEYRRDQLAFYVELAAEAKDPVLELACGTGTVTLELARHGFDVTGLDISPDMLAIAREKLTREGPDVQRRVAYVEGDMAEFSMDRDYSTVLIPNSAFGYLTTADDQKRCLAAVYRHLRSGGTIVVEERFYTPDVLAGMLARRAVPTVQMARTNPATGKYTTFHWILRHIDFVRQTIHTSSYVEEIDSDGTVRRHANNAGGDTVTRFFSLPELQLLIEQAGFEILHAWGNHNRQPIAASSYNMILAARKG